MFPIDSNGNTIAHLAAEGGHISIFKVLTLHFRKAWSGVCSTGHIPQDPW